MARVRVRGIAATALTKLLMDDGHVIVQASRVIQERFGIPLNTAPADVTVKDGGCDELVVIGFPREAESVLESIVSRLGYVFVWKPRLNLHSIVVGRVVDKRGDVCVVELPNGVYGELGGCSKNTGDLVVVSIARPAIKPWEEPRLSTSLRVVGEYVALIYGSQRLSISEHVRDPVKRRELLATATSAVIGKGFGVHLRSSSNYASPEDIVGEVRFLEDKLKEIIEKARSASEPCIVYEGELVSIVGLTSVAKEVLDSIRDSVVPTIRRHHSLKSYSGCLSDIVDYIETGLAIGLDKNIAYNAIEEYIVSKLTSRQRIGIIHVRPDGRILKLTPGVIEYVSRSGNGYLFRVKRVFKSEGVYDGLGVEKKPGDYDIMVFKTDSWVIRHNYYRENGEYIGSYININTPPEIYPDTIKYHDLAVDIIVDKSGEAKVVDKEELEELHRQGIIPEKLYKKTQEVLQETLEEISRRETN